ncbi:MAG: transcription elongation factor GreA [Chloroflexi bacterium]|nr:transcription elongation factor GreA [Chloroflexota bacterium]
MTDEPQYLTQEGYEKLKAELEDLINVQRPELAVKLKDAISMGDLKENADYHDAKERQAFLEGRIRQLEGLLKDATIINEDHIPTGVVAVGRTVTVQEEDFDPETFRIVGAAEANPMDGLISNESPLGQALLGKKKGEKVKVQTDAGEFTYKIKSVE